MYWDHYPYLMNKPVLEVLQDPLLRHAEPILVALSRQELES